MLSITNPHVEYMAHGSLHNITGNVTMDKMLSGLKSSKGWEIVWWFSQYMCYFYGDEQRADTIIELLMIVRIIRNSTLSIIRKSNKFFNIYVMYSIQAMSDLEYGLCVSCILFFVCIMSFLLFTLYVLMRLYCIFMYEEMLYVYKTWSWRYVPPKVVFRQTIRNSEFLENV